LRERAWPSAPPHVVWHLCNIAKARMDFRFRVKSGNAADIVAMSEFGIGTEESTISVAKNFVSQNMYCTDASHKTM
jgi:hypothetical protein